MNKINTVNYFYHKVFYKEIHTYIHIYYCDEIPLYQIMHKLSAIQ